MSPRGQLDPDAHRGRPEMKIDKQSVTRGMLMTGAVIRANCVRRASEADLSPRFPSGRSGGEVLVAKTTRELIRYGDTSDLAGIRKRLEAIQANETIITGIAATPHVDIENHVLLADAVDVTRRGVPLFWEHKRQIGEVCHMQYVGHDLYINAETSDADALKLDHLSIAGKSVHREQRGDFGTSASSTSSRFLAREISGQ